MAQKSILFRGARFEDAKIYSSNSGQLSVDVSVQATWTREVCEAMGWSPEAPGFGTGNLIGSLSGVKMTLEPNSSRLKDYRLDLSIASAHSFKHTVKMKEGKIEGQEVRFIVTTVDPEAPMYVSQIIDKCNPGDDRGQLKIQFTEDEQMTIEGETETVDKPRGRRAKAAE